MTTCRADAVAACPWRYAAVRTGAMSYALEARTWLWWASPLHIWPVVRCPGCSGALPTPETMVARWQADGWPNTDEGEE